MPPARAGAAMNEAAGGLGLGQVVDDVRLETADGGTLTLSSLRGRPLLAVCVRYYG